MTAFKISIILSLNLSLGIALGASNLAFAQAPSKLSSPQVCPKDFNELAAAIAKDLPSYLTRTYTRLKFKSQVVVIGMPELSPLPLAAGSISTSQSVNSLSDPRQMFIRVREREAGSLEFVDKSYWLFISDTRRGWRLSMAFIRINNAPPQDVSEGAIASAVNTWLRDRCIANTYQ